MSAHLLSESDLRDTLSRLPQWTIRAGASANELYRDFKFASFADAFGFMTIAALHIEKLDHHPDWSNVYNRVSVALSSHDAGGITKRDEQLATVLDSIARRFV